MCQSLLLNIFNKYCFTRFAEHESQRCFEQHVSKALHKKYKNSKSSLKDAEKKSFCSSEQEQKPVLKCLFGVISPNLRTQGFFSLGFKQTFS